MSYAGGYYPKEPQGLNPVTVTLALIVAVIIGFVILTNAAKKDEQRNGLYECIERKSEYDQFPGNLKEAWVIYYESCAVANPN